MSSGGYLVIGLYVALLSGLMVGGSRSGWASKYQRSIAWALVPGGVALVFFVGLKLESNKTEYKTIASQQTEVDVQALLIGVWTHTRPVSQDREPYGWERWAFTSGAVQIQSARPSDTQWGSPELYGYEITRKKTADTGQWYWHVHIKDTALNAAVTEDGNALVVFRLGADSNYLLRKEDKDLTK